MSSSLPVTAIFDIGKTNKKFLLFDESYSIVYKRQIYLEESEDDDGFPSEDMQKMIRWIQDEFRAVTYQKKYDITDLNFTSYGATLVHLDQEGQPTTPVYNYLKPYPEELAAQFYDNYGGKEFFAMETASPPMGMLNSGLQLYWLKHQKPELFQKVYLTLHLPQYLSYLFTQKKSADLTSLGCHTGMWHFENQKYHHWLKEEDLLTTLPPVKSFQTTWKDNFLKHPVRTGIGIHDSSAALVPYLLALNDPFIQLSTGTWSIALNPYTSNPLTFAEIERDCLHYLNIYGKPVKASRVLLGAEYSHQINRMGKYFGKDPSNLELEPDPMLIQELVKSNDPKKKLMLEKAYATGPHPQNEKGEWNLSPFKSYEEAAHQCMLDLASIQVDALRLAEGKNSTNQVIITGGFSKNSFFCRLLATLLPDKKIYTASTPYASALGAALALSMESLNEERVKSMLGLNHQKPFIDLRIDHYSWADSIH